MEKAARAARKRALVDMNAHETQEGVMDSLMEALQTGSAFSRPDQRRKRPTRVAGGKFYKATYIWRQMAKKERATQRYTLRDNLCENSAKLKHESVNVTPHAGIARRDIFRRIAEVRTPGDSVSYFTPEENQELYKQMLIDEAKKTPKLTKHMSRITYFQKRRQCSRCSRAYFTTLPVDDDETPKRNVLLETFANLESTADKTDSDICVDENVLLLNEARMLSPVKQKRVVVSKIRKRNSIVRRAISNRRRMRANLRRRRSHTRMQSPPNMSSSMPPIVNWSASSTNIADVGLSKSTDNIFTKPSKRASTPIKLLRSRNYENLTWFKDENLNIQYKKGKSFNSSTSIEMSGVALLSESSQASLHAVKSNNSTITTKSLSTSSEEACEKFTSTQERSFLEASILSKRSNYNQFKTSRRKSRKKNWKFWRKPKSIGI